jgi:hypothetical protein
MMAKYDLASKILYWNHNRSVQLLNIILAFDCKWSVFPDLGVEEKME